MSKRPNRNAQKQRAITLLSWGVTLAIALGVASCALFQREPDRPLPPATQNETPSAITPATTRAVTVAGPKTVGETWTFYTPSSSATATVHTFVFRTDQPAQRVAVAGTFNGWSKDANPLQRQADGSWRADLPVSEGVHHYKYVIDGDRWLTDPASDRTLEQDDNFGGKNSAVLVGFDARQLPPPADNAIEPQAIRHRPNDTADADVVSPTSLRLAIRVQAGDVEHARVHYQVKGDSAWQTRPLHKQTSHLGFDRFGGMINLPRGPVRYVFELIDGSSQRFVGGSGVSDTRDAAARQAFASTLQPAVIPPAWAKDAIWYQIFPERFRNGDPSNDPPNTKVWTSDWWSTLPGEAPGAENFYKGKGNVWNRRYGGDIKGLIDSLPYLRELGVNAIYLNPMFEAESMHKYDTSDFRHIDQHFGVKGDITKLTGETNDPSTWQWTPSDKLFLQFVEEAHKQGFKVVIDGVFNHVGRAHPFFQDVLKNGRKSRYADWFDVVDWTPPIKYHAWDKFGEPSTDGALPNFKKSAQTGLAEGPRQHIMAITRRWLAPNGDPSKGVDGFRLDVANDIPHAFWIDWRKLVKQTKPDAYISGEIWTWAQPWLQGDQFDAVMNYRFMETGMNFFVNQNKAIAPSVFNVNCFELVNNYSYATALAQMNLFDSHDTDRFASMFVNPDLPFDGANRLQDNGPNYRKDKPNEQQWTRMKQAVAWQMTFVGAPMLYYGTEAGMWSPDDPSNRMPMIWRGMTFDDPQITFKADLFEHYQRLIALRRQLTALRQGNFRPALIDDARSIYAYVRESGGQQVYVVLNRGDEEQSVQLPVDRDGAYINWMRGASLKAGDRPELVAGESRLKSKDKLLPVTLGAYETAIVSLER